MNILPLVAVGGRSAYSGHGWHTADPAGNKMASLTAKIDLFFTNLIEFQCFPFCFDYSERVCLIAIFRPSEGHVTWVEFNSSHYANELSVWDAQYVEFRRFVFAVLFCFSLIWIKLFKFVVWMKVGYRSRCNYWPVPQDGQKMC